MTPSQIHSLALYIACVMLLLSCVGSIGRIFYKPELKERLRHAISGLLKLAIMLFLCLSWANYLRVKG